MKKITKQVIKPKNPLIAGRNALRKVTFNLNEDPEPHPNRLFVSDNLKRLAGEVRNAWSMVDEDLLEQLQPTSVNLTFKSNTEAEAGSKTLESIYQEIKNVPGGLSPVKVVNRTIKVGLDFFIPNILSDTVNLIQETNCVELDHAELGPNIAKPYLEFFKENPTIALEFGREVGETRGASELNSSLIATHHAFISFLKEMVLVSNRTHHFIEVHEDHLIIDGRKRADLPTKAKRGILILALFRYQTWFKTDDFCSYYNGPEGKDASKVFCAVLAAVKKIIPKVKYDPCPNSRSIIGVRFRVIWNDEDIKKSLNFQAKVD